MVRHYVEHCRLADEAPIQGEAASQLAGEQQPSPGVVAPYRPGNLALEKEAKDTKD